MVSADYKNATLRVNMEKVSPVLGLFYSFLSKKGAAFKFRFTFVLGELCTNNTQYKAVDTQKHRKTKGKNATIQ